jgi:hypothetical protein
MSKILIIGGGFFGMYLGEYFALNNHEVLIIEKEKQFMKRASFANQARVHNGYHYPRSLLTALRSRISFPRFVKEFNSCIVNDFKKYYLIGRILGKVTAKQFLMFCDRIEAPCEPVHGKINSLFNPSLIESCYSVVEYAFDADKIRDIMIERLSGTKVSYKLETTVNRIYQHNNGLIIDFFENSKNESKTVYADHVFNCTYSSINNINYNSGLSLVPLKHEMTEICLVKMPEEINNIGLTVMCGPFFSVMPFPSLNTHSFTHVRYTPHYYWLDSDSYKYDYKKYNFNVMRKSAWHYMQKDAMRYIPLLSECRYEESLWEIKTVLPRSETDDSRPILFLPHYNIKGYHCILGGKIDNVYDVIDSISNQHIIN